jgi:single-stranded-DNA-specific exonuclease
MREHSAPSWVLAPADDQLVARLASSLRIPRPIARLLVARGHSDVQTLRAEWNPAHPPALSDPSELPDMDRAAPLVAQAIRSGRRILVYGDFDVDGVTATALLVQALRAWGGQVVWYLPHRIEDGYGLGQAAAFRCLERWSPDLIITADCGTRSVETVAALRARGVDVVITDHHALGDQFPPATAGVNPHRTSTETPWRHLSGAGVALYLARAVAAALNREFDALGSMPWELASLGTIADCVPLHGDNRRLVRHGLYRLAHTPSCGLRALAKVAGISQIRTTWQVGFLLAPRLNAAGRLARADAAFELLVSADAARAEEIAHQLDTTNRQRQQLEEQALQTVLELVESQPPHERAFAVVAAAPGLHTGVIGIVAARVAAAYRRPTVILALSEPLSRGSCRSFGGIDIAAALQTCAHVLERFGGHEAAAGLDIRPERIAQFRACLNEAVRQQVGGAQPECQVMYDDELRLDDIQPEFVDWIEHFGPYGTGFPPPLWLVRNAEVIEQRILKERHLQLALRQHAVVRRAIAFRQADRTPPPDRVDVLLSLATSEWAGERRVDFHIHDWRPAT